MTFAYHLSKRCILLLCTVVLHLFKSAENYTPSFPAILRNKTCLYVSFVRPKTCESTFCGLRHHKKIFKLLSNVKKQHTFVCHITHRMKMVCVYLHPTSHNIRSNEANSIEHGAALKRRLASVMINYSFGVAFKHALTFIMIMLIPGGVINSCHLGLWGVIGRTNGILKLR